jgi:hypothetical protein
MSEQSNNIGQLKPCPFCGNDTPYFSPRRSFGAGGWSPSTVKCRKCGYYIHADDDDLVIKNWNTRPIEDQLSAELADAKSSIDALGKTATALENDKEYNAGLVIDRDAEIKRLREALERIADTGEAGTVMAMYASWKLQCDIASEALKDAHSSTEG